MFITSLFCFPLRQLIHSRTYSRFSAIGLTEPPIPATMNLSEIHEACFSLRSISGTLPTSLLSPSLFLSSSISLSLNMQSCTARIPSSCSDGKAWLYYQDSRVGNGAPSLVRLRKLVKHFHKTVHVSGTCARKGKNGNTSGENRIVFASARLAIGGPTVPGGPTGTKNNDALVEFPRGGEAT